MKTQSLQRTHSEAVRRVALPMLMSLLLLAATILFVVLPQFEARMMDQKRVQTRQVVDTVWGTLDYLNQQAESGLLTEEEARELAVSYIETLRYGPDKKDYFWVNDMHPRMIVHPYRSDLNGKDISTFEDPNGKRLFSEMVRTVKASGAGYVNYMWQKQDDPSQVVPKVSYVRGFSPWGWVIGSGVYIVDVQAEVAKARRTVTAVSVAAVALAFLLALYVYRQARHIDQQRNQAEARVRENEEKYRTLFASASDALFILKGMSLVDVNERAVEVFQMDRPVLLSKTVIELSAATQEDGEPSEEKAETLMRAALAGDVQTFEWRCVRSDGEFIDTEASVSRLDLQEGPFLLVALRDVSRRKRAEAERAMLEARLLQAQKMEAIGRLAGGIAHDFNNILSTIIGFSELVYEDAPEGSPLRNDVREVIAAGNRGASLAQQILAFTRQTKHETRPLSLNRLAKEVLGFMRSSLLSTVEVRFIERAGDLIVQGDSTQLHQVLMNLCTNASQAMEITGGVLTVGLEEVEIAAAADNSGLDLPPGDYGCILVRDTGPGIDPAAQAKIFEPYFTTKSEGRGTGLGLATVQSNVARHGGTITVSSKPGEGTEFRVYLPLTDSPAETKAEKPDGPIRGAGQRVVVVDDELPVLEAHRRLLATLGYEVIAYNEPKDALRWMRDNIMNVDMLLTDNAMPEMRGVDLAERVISLRRDLPVVLVTGFADRELTERALSVGIRMVLGKPLLTNDLALAVHSVLSGGGVKV